MVRTAESARRPPGSRASDHRDAGNVLGADNGSSGVARASVTWQSRSRVMEAAVASGWLGPAANGGNAYDYTAVRVLSESFLVSLDPTAVLRPGEPTAKYALRMRGHRPACDVAIAEPYPLVFGPRRPTHRRIAMVHHLDERPQWKSAKHALFQRALLNRLRRVDCVVTVSRYWRDHLHAAGCRNVRIIYNSFDPAEFAAGHGAREAFRRAHGIPLDERLIYIGNASARKGVAHVHRALRDRGYQLVMSGPENRAPDVPVRFLRLERADYVGLLRSCDAVVCMSLFAEGWNRIAHEALLCGTPVIGSGAGGMRELLEGAGQLIVRDFADLPAALAHVLERRSEYAAQGRAFVGRFDRAYFADAWHECVADVLRGQSPS